ncbi:MAG: YgeY family selenium metabolism-linked hydrolase, partial [Chloroflexi bacterium]|nr:YgeY family selenium metabolism-linked hydrolase [Chloroflexota bacterium]
MSKVPEIQKRVAAQRDDIIKFMREICAIPSMDSKIGEVGKRIQDEM